MKTIIFDSSSLISLSMNGLYEELKKLKKIFNGKFLVTKEVKVEIIDRPLNIKSFELEALKLKELLDEKILEMPSALGINENEITEETKKMINIANNTFFEGGKQIHLIDAGEASCLALSRILNTKNINNVISIDERTTRMLVEKPKNLEKLLSKKLHSKINFRKENLEYFRGFRIIRSAELVYVAYKKSLVELKDRKNVLDALLWAVKFKGCAISTEEINEIERIG